jgi:ribosomal protein S18 acetylase RimI-like enzyme
MFVRTAGAGDVAAIGALLAATWHDTYDAIYGVERVAEIVALWHSANALRSQLDRPHSEFLVADDGKAIAGMAFATYDEETKSVMLRQLYVWPGEQGRGIGGLLLDEIEGCFPGAETVRLEVQAANAKAVAFYVAQGFTKVGETANCGQPDSGIPAEIYERAIIWAE